MTSEIVTEEQAAQYRLKYLQKFMGLSEEEGRSLVAILTQETPKEQILERPIRGGGKARYVPGFRFIQRFNDAFGFLWSQEFPEAFERDGQIVSKGRWSLQIPGRTITKRYPDGMEETVRFDGFSVIKEHWGSAEVKKYAQDILAKDRQGKPLKNSQGQPVVRYKRGDVMDLGNDYKAASTDAMKKCGTELGMFLDVYGQREQSEESGPSDQQLQSFYFRAEKAGMDKEKAEAWAVEQTGKQMKELEQQAVLGLVADLIDLAKEQK